MRTEMLSIILALASSQINGKVAVGGSEHENIEKADTIQPTTATDNIEKAMVDIYCTGPLRYPGGDNGLYSFIIENLTYPESAIEENIEGKVVVQFKISKTGDVVETRISKSVNPAIDEEAQRVVRLLKGFSNAEDIWYTLPINFKLPDEQEAIDEALPKSE